MRQFFIYLSFFALALCPMQTFACDRHQLEKEIRSSNYWRPYAVLSEIKKKKWLESCKIKFVEKKYWKAASGVTATFIFDGEFTVSKKEICISYWIQGRAELMRNIKHKFNPYKFCIAN